MTILDQHCEKLGRDPADIHRTAVAMIFLTDDDKFAAKMNASTDRPPRIAGNVSQLQDIIGAYKEIGVDEFVVPDFSLGMDLNEQKMQVLDTFISEIAPVAR
jgi:alkanesulfonate monooxygenase SsuD/methylene tetrahydromethanopterin reductase-like flavin-dependent oxidoreductase (luciferase family)